MTEGWVLWNFVAPQIPDIFLPVYFIGLKIWLQEGQKFIPKELDLKDPPLE
jgi:hypothetical protein